MEDLREQYQEKKKEMQEKYKDIIYKIGMARGVDVGVAFDMLVAVCRGGDYLDGIADFANDTVGFDYEELKRDYQELTDISIEIAKASGLLD